MKLKRLSYLLLIIGVLFFNMVSIYANETNTTISSNTFTETMKSKGYTVEDNSYSSWGDSNYSYTMIQANINEDIDDERILFIYFFQDEESDVIEQFAEMYSNIEELGDVNILSSSNVEGENDEHTASFSVTCSDDEMSIYIVAYRLENTYILGASAYKNMSNVNSIMDEFGYSDFKVKSENNTTLIIIGIIVVIVFIYFVTKKKKVQSAPVSIANNNTEEVAFCSECGTKNKGNSKLCIKCGDPLENGQENIG